MSYEPTNWKTGDVVTAAKLNKMENGIAEGGGGSGGGGVYLIHATRNSQGDTVTDKTWQQIHDAMYSGQLCVVCYTSDENMSIEYVKEIHNTTLDFDTSDGEHWYANSADDYPVHEVEQT